MDTNALVNNGHALVRALDAGGLSPRLAMWVRNTETDTWKLWLVPPPGNIDKHEFYSRLARIISANRQAVGDLDAGDTEMKLDKHPAVVGLRSFIRAPGLSSIHFAGNSFNGFYLPEGIILRSDL